MSEEGRRFTAKDFHLETTFQTEDPDEGGEGKVTMLYNGEVALNITINAPVVWEAIRTRILQYLYLETLDPESRKVIEPYYNPEQFADLDTVEGVQYVPQLVRAFEAHMTDPKLIDSVWTTAAVAAASLINELPTRLAKTCKLAETEEVHRFMIKTAYTPSVARKLEKTAAASIQKYEAAQTKKRFELPGRGGSDPKVEATDEQCKLLAQGYPAKLKFWQDVEKLQLRNRNWREHIKLHHPDTPDELLDCLENLDPYLSTPSAIAFEHVARMSGIETKGCSESTLKRLKKRGKKLLSVTQS